MQPILLRVRQPAKLGSLNSMIKQRHLWLICSSTLVHFVLIYAVQLLQCFPNAQLGLVELTEGSSLQRNTNIST